MIQNVGQYESCMATKLPIIFKRTRSSLTSRYVCAASAQLINWHNSDVGTLHVRQEGDQGARVGGHWRCRGGGERPDAGSASLNKLARLFTYDAFAYNP